MPVSGNSTPAHLGGLGVYIHWPFCLSKCPYCDFNSHVRDRYDEDAFLAAYVRELDHYRGRAFNMRTQSIFFGGGTPSLMSADLVGALIEAVHLRFPLLPDAEITLEANPTSVEAQKFAGYRAAGVNRLSIGIQSLRAEALAALGREHSVDDAMSALALAAKYFDRYSFDLIYAREGQTIDAWQNELAEAIQYAAGHMSLYQLTIEPGTAFKGRFDKGLLVLPEEDDAADMFALTRQMMLDAGMPAYEVSNHAAAAQESQHNLIYWRGGEYVGLGPGAHGRIISPEGVMATANQHKPEGWLTAVAAQGHGCASEAILSAQERAEERLMMGLRLSEGLQLDASISEILDPRALANLQEEGFLEYRHQRLVLTDKGAPLLNEILRLIIA